MKLLEKHDKVNIVWRGRINPGGHFCYYLGVEDNLSSRLARIEQRVAEHAAKVGRDPSEVALMAVTKNHPREVVRQAYDAGIRLFGENRVQEALSKYAERPEGIELHLIGHLQRNKAKHVPAFFSMVESIDRVETAAALNTQCASRDIVLNILLELNTSGEQSKEGFRTRDALEEALKQISEFPHINIRGLMTVGPFTSDEVKIRESFRALAEVYKELGQRYPELSLDTLSMGMSNDYHIAVEEGATLLRIGTALFGARGYE